MSEIHPVALEYLGRGQSAAKNRDGLYALRLLTRWLEETGLDLLKVKPDNLRGFKNWLENKKNVILISRTGRLAPATINGIFRVLRIFFRWLFDNGRIPLDVSGVLASPYAQKDLSQGSKFTPEEVRALLTVQAERVLASPALSRELSLHLRDLAVLCVGIVTGGSFAQVAEIQRSDLDLRKQTLTFNWRTYKLPPWTVPILAEYLDKCRIQRDGLVFRSPFLFPGTSSLQMHKEAIKKAVRELRSLTCRRYPHLQDLAHKYVVFKQMRLDEAPALPVLRVVSGRKYIFTGNELAVVAAVEASKRP